MKLITPVLLLAAGVLSTPAYANTVVPNFTRGTINATTVLAYAGVLNTPATKSRTGVISFI